MKIVWSTSAQCALDIPDGVTIERTCNPDWLALYSTVNDKSTIVLFYRADLLTRIAALLFGYTRPLYHTSILYHHEYFNVEQEITHEGVARYAINLQDLGGVIGYIDLERHEPPHPTPHQTMTYRSLLHSVVAHPHQANWLTRALAYATLRLVGTEHSPVTCSGYVLNTLGKVDDLNDLTIPPHKLPHALL